MDRVWLNGRIDLDVTAHVGEFGATTSDWAAREVTTAIGRSGRDRSHYSSQ